LDTGGGEAAGNGFADAAASAGDERGCAFEREDGFGCNFGLISEDHRFHGVHTG
jgi:hypothetical protein